MRIAVLSDVHGNLEALLAVLRDVDRSAIDRLLCLGDNIGYGPDPEAVVGIMRERNIPCVMGNHELGVLDPTYLEWFNPLARKSLLITAELITASTFDYIRGLNASMVAEGSLCVHGAPPASVTTYLFELSQFELYKALADVEQKICFVGHTHVPEVIEIAEETVGKRLLGEGLLPLLEDRKYIVNVGSVGQPRDGNNNAKYVVWDTVAHEIELRYVPYDIAVTAEKIIRRGLPSTNAKRLW